MSRAPEPYGTKRRVFRGDYINCYASNTIIYGSVKDLYGHGNVVIGAVTTVHGNRNFVCGSVKFVYGKQNRIYGDVQTLGGHYNCVVRGAVRSNTGHACTVHKIATPTAWARAILTEKADAGVAWPVWRVIGTTPHGDAVVEYNIAGRLDWRILRNDLGRRTYSSDEDDVDSSSNESDDSVSSDAHSSDFDDDYASSSVAAREALARRLAPPVSSSSSDARSRVVPPAAINDSDSDRSVSCRRPTLGASCRCSTCYAPVRTARAVVSSSSSARPVAAVSSSSSDAAPAPPASLLATTRSYFERALAAMQADLEHYVTATQRIIESSDASRKRPADDAAVPPAKRQAVTAPPLVGVEEPAAAGELLCQLCEERSVKTANRPCGHSFMCLTCARAAAVKDDATCYVCNAKVAEFQRIYLTGTAAAPAPTPARAVAPSKDPERADALRQLFRDQALAVEEMFGLVAIYVKTLAGTIHLVPVERDGKITIGALKERIEPLVQLAPYEQRLVYDGKALDDAKTLADYGIAGNATVHVVGTLRGD